MASKPPFIHANAWKAWERHDVELLLTDVVDALLALPEERVVRGTIAWPPRLLPTLEGEVYGRRFRLIGDRGDADEWSAIFEVQPL